MPRRPFGEPFEGPQIYSQNIAADDLSCLECDQSINARTSNVHVKNQALIKMLRHYVEATSDYPEVTQTYNSALCSGTITTAHYLGKEYKYNHALVTDYVFEV